MGTIILKEISTDTYEHGGYGAGSGYITRNEYECPCGKGRVRYEKEAIPGFRSTDITCYCSDCNQKYDFEDGVATEKE